MEQGRQADKLYAQPPEPVGRLKRVPRDTRKRGGRGAGFGFAPCVALLLAASAALDLRNGEGKTAKEKAKENGHEDVVLLLS